jgi:hypothetical protein
LYVTAVKFFGGNEALLNQPFENGIGHSQGSARDTGKIPLMEQISARAVNVFKDDKFGIGEEFIHDQKIKHTELPKTVSVHHRPFNNGKYRFSKIPRIPEEFPENR